MFNHLSDAHEAAVDLLAAVLGRGPAAAARARPAARLARRLHRAGNRPRRRASTLVPHGQLRLRYGHMRGTARPAARRHRAQRQRQRPAAPRRRRPVDGPPAREPDLPPAARAPAAHATDIAGRYRCDELDAELTVTDAGGVLYGGFSGFLGQSRMELLDPIGAGSLGAALPARAGPHPARRLDAVLPTRRHRPPRHHRSRLLARPPPALRPHPLSKQGQGALPPGPPPRAKPLDPPVLL